MDIGGMDVNVRLGVLLLLSTIGLKVILFGQYWPWQFRHRCPYCKRPWTS